MKKASWGGALFLALTYGTNAVYIVMTVCRKLFIIETLAAGKAEVVIFAV